MLLTGRNARSLEAARRQLGERAHVLRSDAGRLADIDALADEAARALGKVDLLFLNAGYCKVEPFWHVSEATYDQTFAVNTKGPSSARSGSPRSSATMARWSSRPRWRTPSVTPG